MAISILNIDHHRNGISGAPFYAVVFRDTGSEGSIKVAVLFDSLHHVAVLDIAKLADCDIEFGSNSWRGDFFELALRRAIRKHNRQAETETNGKEGARS